MIRIRPQTEPGESVDGLVEDVWKSIPCDADPLGCSVEFDDPDFASGGRDTVYYVRAIQEPTPQINAGNLRCEYDADGNCIAVDPCFAGYPTARDDQCLSVAEARAFSSPIFVDFRVTDTGPE